MITRTTLEDLSVELFYEIFSYFQFHELSKIFSNLNGRFAGIVNKMPLTSVHLGLSGMSVSVAEFYYRHLLQSNVCNHIISLYVSDTFAIDNGLWLAKHFNALTNLRHLSLIDIKRTSFELFLKTSSSKPSLVTFSVRYSLCNYRAVYTFEGIPEGAYHERIFQLFPSLQICDLRFWRFIRKTLDNEIVLPVGQSYVPIKTSLLKLKSMILRECSLNFLKHLLEHLPQLNELSFCFSTSWLPDGHPLMNLDNNRIATIDKRLLPNLRRLKIASKYTTYEMALLERLFNRDVLLALTNFTLVGVIIGPDIVSNFLSMISEQCCFTFDVQWYRKTLLSLSDASTVLLDTFQQLKGRAPVELKLDLSPYHCGYSIEAFTLPQQNKSLYARDCSNTNIIRAQSRWGYTVSAGNNRSVFVNQITFSRIASEISNEVLSYLSNTISWHHITLLTLWNPFDLSQLRFLVSNMIHLRTLQLHYDDSRISEHNSENIDIIGLLNDTSLCTTLMSNGLQRLNLHINSDHSDTTDFASLIVKQLSHLKILEFNCFNSQILQTLHILMNSLLQLSFVIFHCPLTNIDELHAGLSDLQTCHGRACRMEYTNELHWDAGGTLYVWLG